MIGKNMDNKKTKIPSEDRIFIVDRGGVKPLERDDKPAPENRPDSALVHGDDNINIRTNRKAPCGSSSESRTISFAADLSSWCHYIKPTKYVKLLIHNIN